jgi:hypothetical protein
VLRDRRGFNRCGVGVPDVHVDARAIGSNRVQGVGPEARLRRRDRVDGNFAVPLGLAQVGKNLALDAPVFRVVRGHVVLLPLEVTVYGRVAALVYVSRCLR